MSNGSANDGVEHELDRPKWRYSLLVSEDFGWANCCWNRDMCLSGDIQCVPYLLHHVPICYSLATEAMVDD